MCVCGGGLSQNLSLLFVFCTARPIRGVRARCSQHSVARYFSELYGIHPINSIGNAVVESEVPPIPWKNKKIKQGKQPGFAALDWANLGFEYLPTNGYVASVYVEGKGWGAPEFVNDEYLKLHVAR